MTSPRKKMRLKRTKSTYEDTSMSEQRPFGRFSSCLPVKSVTDTFLTRFSATPPRALRICSQHILTLRLSIPHDPSIE